MSRQTRKTSQKVEPSSLNHDNPCRLDIWLFRTRLLKTRALAAKMISSGKIRLQRNGHTERVKKPHTLIRPSDKVTFMRGAELICVEMLDAGTRRGPAPEAQKLYHRHAEITDTIY